MSTTADALPQLLPLLRCPATGAELERVDSTLRSRSGEREYPIVSGVPILIAPERSLFDPADYLGRGERKPSLGQRVKAALRRLLELPPRLGGNFVAEDNVRRFVALLRERLGPGQRARVLIVGGATVGVGDETLLNADDFDVLETDVSLSERVAVVCDGHDLPFRDGTFDGVICQAVLEHVLDPQRVADEIWRVLRPGGVVYSEIPFMQQVHAGAYDFTRFTHLGHRRLWRRFDEIRSGADTGPGMALAWSVSYFVRVLTPRTLWPVAARVVSLLFFWLKYFDRWLIERPAALDAASGTFFLGARREDALEDRAIVNSYRGADGPVPRLPVRT